MPGVLCEVSLEGAIGGSMIGVLIIHFWESRWYSRSYPSGVGCRWLVVGIKTLVIIIETVLPLEVAVGEVILILIVNGYDEGTDVAVGVVFLFNNCAISI